MKNTIYGRNFNKLLKIIPNLKNYEVGEAGKSSLDCDCFMDFTLDVLSKNDDEMIIAIAHRYELNGDLVPDPDMEIKVNFKFKFIEALSYQDVYGYKLVYPEKNKVFPKLKKDLNNFLSNWLKNLIEQGHKIKGCCNV